MSVLQTAGISRYRFGSRHLRLQSPKDEVHEEERKIEGIRQSLNIILKEKVFQSNVQTLKEYHGVDNERYKDALGRPD